MRELQRIWTAPKTLLVLLLLAVLNLAVFAGFCRTESGHYAEEAQQRSEQTETYLTSGYQQYLSYITAQSQAQSILGALGKQSSFITRNREQTIADFKALGELTLQSGEENGIRTLLRFTLTDYLMLLAPLLLVMELITAQRSACGAMLRCTKKGRCQLMLWRMLALFSVSAVSVLLLWGGNLMYSSVFFGDPVLDRPLQSIMEFQQCRFALTVGEWFAAMGICKLFAVFCIALLFWLVLSVCQPILSVLVLLLTVGGQWLCYMLIVPAVSFNYPKFCNLFALLDADLFFTDYCNLNWFSYPFGMFESCVIACAILLILISVSCIVCIAMLHPFVVGSRVQYYGEKLRAWCSVRFGCHSLFWNEGKKLLIAQRGLLILVITAALGYSLWQDLMFYTATDYQMLIIYEQYEGEVTDEKLTKIADRIERLENNVQQYKISVQHAIDIGLSDFAVAEAQSKLAQAENELHRYQDVQAALLDVRHYTEDTGYDAWWIRQNAYIHLFSESAGVRRCGMLLLLCLVFLFSGIGAYENQYGANPLLRSTKRGRWGRNRSKLLWIVGLSSIAALALYGIHALRIADSVGFAFMEAPMHSITILRDLPFSISLRSFILLFMAARMLAAVLFALAVAWIGSRCRNTQNALLICLMIFLLPAALCETGIGILRPADWICWLGLYQ